MAARLITLAIAMSMLVCMSLCAQETRTVPGGGQAAGESATPTNSMGQAFLNADRVVFIGDSITYDGEFLVWLEASLLKIKRPQIPELLNLGLPSETCSGLSEPTHPFPRPNVNERIERLLEKLSPDILVANYGINDGIYHPFSQERFDAYQDGISRLIQLSKDHKFQLILVTPLPFDPLPSQKTGRLAKADSQVFDWRRVYEKYDEEVLSIYSDWLKEQRGNVLGVIDVRTPILKHYQNQRKTNPDYVMSKDGVHIDALGHRLLGQVMAKALGFEPAQQASDKMLDLLRSRNRVLRDAWISHVGHLRPNVNKGRPLDEAQAQAAKLNQRLKQLIEQ